MPNNSALTALNELGLTIHMFVFKFFFVVCVLLCVKDVLQLILCGSRKSEIILNITKYAFFVILVYSIPSIFLHFQDFLTRHPLSI